MNEQIDVYVSLDEARTELKKRWLDVELKKKVEMELGERFLPNFGKIPRAFLVSQICSPDNGFTLFFQHAKYIHALPLGLEFNEDIFVHFNEEKRALVRPRLILENGERATVSLLDFSKSEKKKFSEIFLADGKRLIDFHYELFDVAGYKIELSSINEWHRSIGNSLEYYYFLFLHCIAHGVFFGSFLNEGDSYENAFTRNVVIPAFERAKRMFSMKPLVVRLFPENQDEYEDFYWWCYPYHVNKYLIEYAKKNDLKFKNVKF